MNEVLSKITKRPVTVGFDLDMYDSIRNDALANIARGESTNGVFQRWVIAACKERLVHGPRPLPAAPMPPKDSSQVPPNSLAEARMKIEYYTALAEKPGQYGPHIARAIRMREVWEEELVSRQRAAKPKPAPELEEPQGQYVPGGERGERMEFVPDERNDDPEPPVDDYKGDDIV